MNSTDLLATISTHLPAFSRSDVAQVLHDYLADMTTLILPVNALAALSRGVAAGGLVAVLFLFLQAWRKRRLHAKREAASRKMAIFAHPLEKVKVSPVH